MPVLGNVKSAATSVLTLLIEKPTVVINQLTHFSQPLHILLQDLAFTQME